MNERAKHFHPSEIGITRRIDGTYIEPQAVVRIEIGRQTLNRQGVVKLVKAIGITGAAAILSACTPDLVGVKSTSSGGRESEVATAQAEEYPTTTHNDDIALMPLNPSQNVVVGVVAPAVEGLPTVAPTMEPTTMIAPTAEPTPTELPTQEPTIEPTPTEEPEVYSIGDLSIEDGKLVVLREDGEWEIASYGDRFVLNEEGSMTLHYVNDNEVMTIDIPPIEDGFNLLFPYNLAVLGLELNPEAADQYSAKIFENIWENVRKTDEGYDFDIIPRRLGLNGFNGVTGTRQYVNDPEVRNILSSKGITGVRFMMFSVEEYKSNPANKAFIDAVDENGVVIGYEGSFSQFYGLLPDGSLVLGMYTPEEHQPGYSNESREWRINSGDADPDEINSYFLMFYYMLNKETRKYGMGGSVLPSDSGWAKRGISVVNGKIIPASKIAAPAYLFDFDPNITMAIPTDN